MFDAGFTGFMFPAEYGGGGLTVEHQQAFFEEAAGYVVAELLRGVDRDARARRSSTTAPRSRRRGTCPKILRGDEIFVQLLSEPSGGSDMAGALTRRDARRRHVGDQRLEDLDLGRATSRPTA